jgi:hypothetical protein
MLHAKRDQLHPVGFSDAKLGGRPALPRLEWERRPCRRRRRRFNPSVAYAAGERLRPARLHRLLTSMRLSNTLPPGPRMRRLLGARRTNPDRAVGPIWRAEQDIRTLFGSHT